MKSPKHSGEAVCLPAGGLRVSFIEPTGWDDLLVREARSSLLALGHAVVERLARAADGESVRAADLCVADFEAVLLALRQALLGDVILAEAKCGSLDCGKRVDLSFRISAYLKSQKARMPRGIENAGPGWYGLAGAAVRFRLPTGADLLAIEHQAASYPALVRLCIDPPDAPAALRKRAENAMEAMAPSFSRSLAGECAECRAPLEVYFDVRSYVLRELYDRAASVYRDVHLLALHYGWAEEKILALPQSRRIRYVDLLRYQGVAA
jgi:hypothetical protein